VSTPARTISLGLLLAGVAIAVRVAAAGDGHGRAQVQVRSEISAPILARAPSSPAAAGGSPRQRLSPGQAQRAFVGSYLAYLSGSLPASRLRYASITARDQAASGGRIPASFRDGPLKVRAITGQGSTLYSAQATVDAVNRSQSYPFTVSLLREPNGWQVAQLQPPDLSIDQHTRPVIGVRIPRAGQLAAARFAVAYADYRAAAASRPAAITSTAAAQLGDQEDPLVQTRLPRARARLLALSYGPLEQDRFAVSATVAVAGRQVRFTVLMFDSRRGWECDAFL
jgi:hypothetical protein